MSRNVHLTHLINPFLFIFSFHGHWHPLINHLTSTRHWDYNKLRFCPGFSCIQWIHPTFEYLLYARGWKWIKDMVAPYSPAQTNKLLQLCVKCCWRDTHRLLSSGDRGGLHAASEGKTRRDASWAAQGKLQTGLWRGWPAGYNRRRCYWLTFGPTGTNRSWEPIMRQANCLALFQQSLLQFSYSVGERSESKRVKWPAQVYTASNWQSSDLEQSLESACNAGVPGDLSLIPGSGRSPGGGNGNLLSVFLPGKTHGQRSLVGYSPWGPKESARLSAEIFPSNYTSRHAMLLSPHHWNTFHVFPRNLYCLFVHPTADNTVLSTTEKSPTADLLRRLSTSREASDRLRSSYCGTFHSSVCWQQLAEDDWISQAVF